MSVLQPGVEAPPLAIDAPAVHAVVFFKVTCEVCQMAAPALARLREAYGDAVVSVGQDPQDRLEAFAGEYGWGIPAIPDLDPYEVSDAYGIESVPTTFLVEDGVITDVVQSWDREGLNRVSARLASVTGAPEVAVSQVGDGLPAFRPG